MISRSSATLLRLCVRALLPARIFAIVTRDGRRKRGGLRAGHLAQAAGARAKRQQAVFG